MNKNQLNMFRKLPSPIALRALEAAVRCRSFKQASSELAVTPTAISHQIRGLESQLGLQLFVRTGRDVIPTEPAERLAQVIAQGFSAIQAELENIRALQTTLTISTTPAFAALWLVPRLQHFQSAHPHIKVQVETSTQKIALDRDARVDLVIRYAQLPELDYVLLHQLHESLGVYCSEHYARQLGNKNSAELIDITWQQQPMPERGWNQWLTQAKLGDAFDYKMRQFDQEHHAIHCALAGQGLVLTSSLLVSDFVSRSWLQAWHPGIQLPGFQYYLYSTVAKAQLSKVKHFTQWMINESQG